MLYSTLVVAASALAGFASAQSSNTTFGTPIPCCSVPASSVDSSDRATWCQANTNTCVDLCGGQANIASNGNECDDTTLQYTCQCTNGTNAATALNAYQQSVPGLMCRYWYDACVNATNQNREQLFECERARDTQCGNLTINDNGDISSASASASASATASRTSGSAASATSGAASETPKAGAASFAQYGAPVLAAGLLAAFGIAL